MKLGLGFGLGGSGGASGYYIAINGAAGGSFNETTGVAGVIGTATSNIGGTITWSIVAGSDARISINSSTGAVSTSGAIFSGDSAAFTVRANNGTRALEFPFTAVGTVSYAAEASALFARFSTDPGSTRKTAINTFIVALKTAGVWTKLDGLYILAAHSSQAAQRNWIADQYNLTENNSPTFTTDRGYTGNGTNMYLDTGFNPSTASSPQFTRNSAHAGVWSRTESLANYDMGETVAGLGVNPRSSTANTMRGYVNDTAAAYNYGSNTTSVGHFIISRSSSSSTVGYINSTATSTVTSTSTALGSGTITILRNLTGYSSRQIAAAHFGAHLSGADASAFYSALNTYLVTVGAA